MSGFSTGSYSFLSLSTLSSLEESHFRSWESSSPAEEGVARVVTQNSPVREVYLRYPVETFSPLCRRGLTGFYFILWVIIQPCFVCCPSRTSSGHGPLFQLTCVSLSMSSCRSGPRFLTSTRCSRPLLYISCLNLESASSPRDPGSF